MAVRRKVLSILETLGEDYLTINDVVSPYGDRASELFRQARRAQLWLSMKFLIRGSRHFTHVRFPR
jgi:hypothetical protein